ncbi:MAG: hypothetical protein ACI89X_000331 [Planctomycetota bacterium]|jgi:hypothetical protein
MTMSLVWRVVAATWKVVSLQILAVLSFAGAAASQVPALVFTGSHPFVSLGAANERPGGAINQITEYDFTLTLPNAGGSIARTLMPATAMHCYLGDANYDGNFLKLHDWKTAYSDPIGLGGVFVREADRTDLSWDKVFFSVRFGAPISTAQFEIFVGGGIPYLIEPSDWVRLLPNGDSQWFIAPGQLLQAAGAQQNGTSVGAGALLQAANGDLYYSPSDGGHWLNSVPGLPLFAEDGSICKIDAADITYDGNGNISGFAPDSARLLINESLASGSPSIRSWVQQAAAFDRVGAALQAADYGKTGGLAFDPAGGTWTPAYANASGNFVPEPNLIFCTESPEYGGTLFSSQNGGEVAMLNGVLCGSTTAGVAADGAWLGVQLDIANDQPSLLGLCVIEVPPLPQPFLADQTEFGALAIAATQSNWDVDFFGEAGMPLLALLSAGPSQPTSYAASLPATIAPLSFGPNSWPDVFLVAPIFTFGATTTDSFGYATVSIPNPNPGGFAGFTMIVQGLSFASTGLQLSSPVMVQLQ